MIEPDKIPVGDELREYCHQYNLEVSRFALSGGEDYVLLGTVAEDKAASLESALVSAGCAFSGIGVIDNQSGIRLKSADGGLMEIEGSGFDHFKGR